MSLATLTQTETAATGTTTLTQMPATLESSNSKLAYLYLATVDEATNLLNHLPPSFPPKQPASPMTKPTLATEADVRRMDHRSTRLRSSIQFSFKYLHK